METASGRIRICFRQSIIFDKADYKGIDIESERYWIGGEKKLAGGFVCDATMVTLIILSSLLDAFLARNH